MRPIWARRVVKGELTPERAIRIVATELVKKEKPAVNRRAFTLGVSGPLPLNGSLLEGGSLRHVGLLWRSGSLIMRGLRLTLP
jgi:hypothetical protein